MVNQSYCSAEQNEYHYAQMDQYAQNEKPRCINTIGRLNKLGLKKSDKILDLGCRVGILDNSIMTEYAPSERITDLVIHGVDSSKKLIDMAKEKYGHLDNLSFECADILSYDGQEKYDIVISSLLFHWIEDYEQAFRQAYASLKPGGKAFITHLVKDDPWMLKIMKNMVQKETWRKHSKDIVFPIHFRPSDEIINAARAAGFIVKDDSVVEKKTIEFKDLAEYEQGMTSTPMVYLPNDLRQEFVKSALLETFPHEKRTPQGEIVVETMMLYMFLEKPLK